METSGALRLRSYGQNGHQVIVLHGGPAAVGSAAGLARELSDSFQVLEPWQRGSGSRPLTVATHVADLHALIVSRCRNRPPALVGESWGAMLALAYGAAHPETAGPLVLVGCGTFDPEARACLKAKLTERIEALQPQLDALVEAFPDPATRSAQEKIVTKSLYDYAPINPEPDQDAIRPFDVVAHTQTWDDMVRLQEAGVYPAAFAAITSPVLMLHGTYDPHPGRMIHAGLKRYLPQIEYREWERCGHSPWIERYVREDFFVTLRNWLTAQMAK